MPPDSAPTRQADAGRPRHDSDRKPEGEDGRRDAPPKKSLLHNRWVQVGGALLLIALIVGGVLWWLSARHYESTDDAYIDARIVRLAPQIAGRVERVLVDDNAPVEPGQLLVEIDAADAQAKLDQALAAGAQADAQIAQAKAQLGVAMAAVEQAKANYAGAELQAANAARDLARYRTLQRGLPSAVSQQQLDNAQTAASNSAAQRDAADKQVKGSEAQLGAAATQVQAAEAQRKSADAGIAEARLTLSYTKVLAPVAGHVSRRTVAVGAYLQPGQEMMAIVPAELWVIANFKETQLADMRPGQPVRLVVDAYPGLHLEGHVDSIQRGAGQAFALLPAENATGNFVKVVQRVPVKIVIDQPGPPDLALGPGMSVSPRVTVR